MQRSAFLIAFVAVAGLVLATTAGSAPAQVPAADGQVPGVTSTAAPTAGDYSPGPEAIEVELIPSDAHPPVDWTNVLGVDFRPSSTALPLRTSSTTGAFWCEGLASSRYAYARLDIPHGRKIEFFRMWGFDALTPAGVTAELRESCLPDLGPATNPTNTVLASLDSDTSAGNFTVTTVLSPQPVVDAHTCTYWAWVEFDQCGDGATVRKIRVQHAR